MEDVYREHRLAPWLALALAKPLTPTLCRHLRLCFPDAEDLGRCLHDLFDSHSITRRNAEQRLTAPMGPLDAGHLSKLRSRTTQKRVDDSLMWLEGATQHHIVTLLDADYPARLRETSDPPPLLYVRGSTEALEGPAIAVVGSRDVSQSGRELTREFSSSLARAGLVIISGLALGTDAEAHAAALKAAGLTLAFVATGVDRVYPRRHGALSEAIVDRGGALVSEFPLGHAPRPWCFPQRNRLISGSSDAVLIIEARLPSGTLTTARHAIEQNRDVMAVPGPVKHPGSTGCHALIRDGAALVESAEDILLQLAGTVRRACTTDCGLARPVALPRARLPGDRSGSIQARERTTGHPSSPAGRTADEQQVWQCISHQSMSIDELSLRTGLDVANLMQLLAVLEIDGTAVRGADGRYARVQPC